MLFTRAVIGVMAGGCMLLAACGSEEEPPATAVSTAPGSGATPAASPSLAAGDVVRNQPVAEFYEDTCAICHGDRRQGLVGPELTARRLTKPDDFYRDTILNGRPGTAMPSWSQTAGITPDEALAIVRWLKSPTP